MKTYGKKNGFTAVELLTVVAILAVLVGMLLGAAKHVRTRAYERLAASTISVMVTAIEQYYNDNKEFPFVAAQEIETEYLAEVFGVDDLKTTIAYKMGLDPDDPDDIELIYGNLANKYTSIATLYFFLDRSPNSSKIIGAISGKFLANTDKSGAAMTLGLGSKIVPMIWVVDPWGNPFRYRCLAEDSFPVIMSAGPDGKFGSKQPAGPGRDISKTYDNISSADL
jgi:prepilin-type N-terminal cleavage/methylation domain-containing protein